MDDVDVDDGEEVGDCDVSDCDVDDVVGVGVKTEVASTVSLLLSVTDAIAAPENATIIMVTKSATENTAVFMLGFEEHFCC